MRIRVVLCLMLVLLCYGAFAQDSARPAGERRRFGYGAESDFNSAFVWRGIVWSTRPVMQPSGWVSAYGFTLNTWSNLTLSDTPESVHLHTTELGLMYEREWKKLRIEPSVEAYLNRPPAEIEDPNTMEGSLKLSYPVGPLRIFTRHSLDVLAYGGSYSGEGGVGYEAHFTKRTALALNVRSGWASSKFNDVYIGLGKAALSFIGVEGSLTYHLKPSLYLRPHFEFSSIADRRLRAYLSSPTFVNFGLAMGIDF